MAESPKLRAALEYAVNHELKVIVLKGAKSKRPVIRDWPNKATDDPDQIEKWWKANPDSNVGVVLGKRSGIIDVECDDASAEELMLELWGGEFPETPTYSASRGKHRLFKWRPGLPSGEKGVFHIGALEFRTGNNDAGMQSVFPPSMHPSGKIYEWLPGLSPGEVDFAEIPDSVMARIVNSLGDNGMIVTTGEDGKVEVRKPPVDFKKLMDEGSKPGHRNNDMASFIGKQLYGARDLHDEDQMRFLLNMALIQNDQNKPPMTEKEVKEVFTSLWRKEMNRRTAEGDGAGLAPEVVDRLEATGPESRAEFMDKLRLEITLSDPAVYTLYSPKFKRSGDKIVLTSAQAQSGRLVATMALEQSGVQLDPSLIKGWPKTWKRLVDGATYIGVKPEEKRSAVLAQLIYNTLTHETIHEWNDSVKPAPSNIYQDDEGAYLFFYEKINGASRQSGEQFKRTEIAAVFRRTGYEDLRATVEGIRHRVRRLTTDQMNRLRMVADGELMV